MDDLFMVLIIAGIAGFFYFRKKDKKKRNISIITAIVSFVLFGIFSPDVDSEEAEQPKEEQVVDNKDTEKEEKEAEEKKKEQEKKEREEEEAKKEAEKEEAEKKQAEQKEKEEQEATELAETEFNPDDYNKDLTYDDLARTPDEHLFKKVTFEGKIIQVMQGDDYSQYRIATNDNYDKVMLLEIDNEQLSSRILEDDYIRFYGFYMGEITYESALGGNITIPGVVVDRFDFK